MRRITLAQLRHNLRRVIATLLAIMISSGFVASTFMFTDTLKNSLSFALIAQYSHADVVVTAVEQDPAATLAAVRKTDGVSTAESSYQGITSGRWRSTSGAVLLSSLPASKDL